MRCANNITTHVTFELEPKSGIRNLYKYTGKSCLHYAPQMRHSALVSPYQSLARIITNDSQLRQSIIDGLTTEMEFTMKNDGTSIMKATSIPPQASNNSDVRQATEPTQTQQSDLNSEFAAMQPPAPTQQLRRRRVGESELNNPHVHGHQPG
jgi:hypothetical protein